MMTLYLGIAILLGLAVVFVLLGARSGAHTSADGELHRRAQRRFYIQRRNELTADRDAGLIDENQFQELERELDRQLVSESAVKSPNKTLGRRRTVILVIAVVLPILAMTLYAQLGHRLDVELRALQTEVVENGMDEARWQRYQGLVATILARRPESAEHLVMMATLFRQQGDFAGALPYYQRLANLYPEDADVLAQLAQARYLSSDRRVDATTQDLLARSLAINPRQATALGVMGIDAFAAGRYGEALKYWQVLLQVLPANSGEASVIAGGVVEAKRLVMASGEVQGLAIEVSLNSDLGPAPAGVLFVVAKSTDGSPMPVAATRIPLSGQAWPIALSLTDGDVIRQGKVLADFPELIVSAHISLAGTAIRKTGDWVAKPVQISNIADLAPIALHIHAIQAAK